MDSDDLPQLVAENNDSDFDEDNDNDEENDMFEENAECLFCKRTDPCIEESMKHIETDHKLNFSSLRQKFQMDQYSFIKLVNYIRKEKPKPHLIAEADHVFWDDEIYLKPTGYEPWLTYDYEALPLCEENINSPNGKEPSPVNLETLVKELHQKLQDQTILLEEAYNDMEKMRAGFQRLFPEKDNISTESGESSINCVSKTSLKADNSYFESYAHFGIHHEMLSDVVRTSSYHDALLKNQSFINGKTVLDVGCGTAILSIFASQAGAKSVVGIDNSDIIYDAMDIIKQNKIINVELIKGRLEDTKLPIRKYDIIISEWMGYFLLFEGMLDSIIYARDYHLKEGGTLLPNRCTMSIIGYGNDQLYSQHMTFWDNVYGLNMSNMRKKVIHEPLIEIVDPKYILTESNIIADININTIDLNYSNFTYDFKMKCISDGVLSSFVGYFDTFFDLPTQISFSTGPKDIPTHWKQVIFFLNETHKICKNDVISGKLKCRRSRNSARSLDVSIEVFNNLNTYYLD